MSHAPRALLLGLLLATFGALLGCGQRGPLTLPGSAKPIERLDPSKAQPAGGAPSAAGAAGAQAAPADAAPRSEDEERRKSQ